MSYHDPVTILTDNEAVETYNLKPLSVPMVLHLILT